MKLYYSSATPERDQNGNILGWRCTIVVVWDNGTTAAPLRTELCPTSDAAYDTAKAIIAELRAESQENSDGA